MVSSFAMDAMDAQQYGISRQKRVVFVSTFHHFSSSLPTSVEWPNHLVWKHY
jgi:hypothetical protein